LKRFAFFIVAIFFKNLIKITKDNSNNSILLSSLFLNNINNKKIIYLYQQEKRPMKVCMGVCVCVCYLTHSSY
jgi:hypothetical protein